VTRAARVARAQGGLTLVELMVALTLLAIITVGITPLLASALRGVAVTRSSTKGKNLAVEAMERLRGLPFFESVQGQTTPTRVDALDLYFPDRNAGFSSSSNTFTTTCTAMSSTPAASGVAACPKSIPSAYTVTFVAAFVDPGPTSGTPPTQAFTVTPPSTTYNWNATATEAPPTELLRMQITVSWTFGGDPESYSLTSLLGRRRATTETINAFGRVDHALQVLSSYVDSQSRTSSLTATVGQGESSIVSRSVAEADEATNTAHLVLTQDAYAENSAVTLADVNGASSLVHAPPDSYPAPGASAPAATINYSYDATTQVPAAYINDSVVEAPPTPFSLGARVLNQLPTAAGRFRFSGAASPQEPSLWVDNQAERGALSPLKLDDSGHMVILHKLGSNRLLGDTSTEATAVSSGSRKVESKASTSFGKLYVLPTTFITGGEDGVVTVSNFTASITCTSTANAATYAVAGSWSAELNYWSDSNNNGIVSGSYLQTPLQLSGSLTGAADPLAGVRTTNPLVYDDVDNTKDVYLFEDAAAGKKGYFTSITTLPSISSSKSGAGRNTTVALNGAIQMQTAPTSRTNPSVTSMSISVGRLSCQAVDKRGL
jgi:prepilin-type N-terminal cleavage/methylation domain-containing protein